MDLEAIGRPDLAEHFTAAYQRFSGAQWPPSLLHFYVAQRAMVRSKVDCLSAIQGDGSAIPRARAHLAQCRRHLEFARPVLLVIGGGPRTGKSTTARGLAATNGWLVLQSDEVRRDVSGAAPVARGERARLDRGRYTRSMTALTYRMLFGRAKELLSDGYGVILDATFSTARTRLRAGRVARACHADLVEVECQAATNVIRHRAALPRREGDLSEATPEVAEALRSRRDPWPSAYKLDTSGSPSDTVARCQRFIDAAAVGDGSDRVTTVPQVRWQ